MNDQNVPIGGQEELRQTQTQTLRHQNTVIPSTPTTQVDLVGVCQTIAELSVQNRQQGVGGTRGPNYPYERFLHLQLLKFKGGANPLKVEY